MERLHIVVKTWVFILVLSSAAASPSLSQQIDCEEAITASKRNFFNAKFEEATISLKYCLSTEDFTQTKEAYELLAQIYFSIEQYDLSASAIIALLDLDPEHQLPEALPPPFIVYFERTRNKHIRHAVIAEKLRPAPEYKGTPWLKTIDRRWYWIGGGVLVAGTAALILDGDSGSVTFAAPPGPPGGESTNE